MDADERAIYYYLKSRRPKSAPPREISRHVGGRRRFHYAPEWAYPVLLRMTERGILDTDASGNYRLKPMPRADTKGKRWASPQIAALLESSGKKFEGLITEKQEDDYYESL